MRSWSESKRNSKVSGEIRGFRVLIHCLTATQNTFLSVGIVVGFQEHIIWNLANMIASVGWAGSQNLRYQCYMPQPN